MLGKNLNWSSNCWTWGYFFEKRKFENTNVNKCRRVLDFSDENFYGFCKIWLHKIKGTFSDRYTPWRESVTDWRKQRLLVEESDFTFPTLIFEKNI